MICLGIAGPFAIVFSEKGRLHCISIIALHLHVQHPFMGLPLYPVELWLPCLHADCLHLCVCLYLNMQI